jgi:hypothetical protein
LTCDGCVVRNVLTSDSSSFKGYGQIICYERQSIDKNQTKWGFNRAGTQTSLADRYWRGTANHGSLRAFRGSGTLTTIAKSFHIQSTLQSSGRPGLERIEGKGLRSLLT